MSLITLGGVTVNDWILPQETLVYIDLRSEDDLETTDLQTAAEVLKIGRVEKGHDGITVYGKPSSPGGKSPAVLHFLGDCPWELEDLTTNEDQTVAWGKYPVKAEADSA